MFGANVFAKIKKIYKVETNYIDVQILTSKKNKQTNKYEVDFMSIVRFIGKAFQKMPAEGERIKILQCGVNNCYVQNENIVFLESPKYIVFDYERLNSEKQTETQKEPKQTPLVLIEDEGDLPF